MLPPLLLLLLLLSLSPSSALLTIQTLTREISLTHSSHVKTTYSFKIASSAEETSFEVSIGDDRFGRVAKFQCDIDGQAVVAVRKGSTAILVPLGEAFGAGTIKCVTFRVDARRPYPAEIAQVDKQRFLFEADTVRVQTKYRVAGEETTTVILPQGKVDLLAEFPGMSQSGNRITCGPYTAPPSEEEAGKRLQIHFDFNVPMPVAKYAEREIEISHFGNIAFEEYFDLWNGGAKLKGGFSRLDHQARDPGHAFQTLQAHFPSEAYGIYYRDELGNVTSSNVWKPKTGKSTEMKMKLRFPLYGGWHIEWYHGYNVPLTTFVNKVAGDVDRYVLDCDVAPPISVPVERLILHVVLPPGATNVKIETPSALTLVSQKTTRRYTYFDVPWATRNVLALELADVFGGDRTEMGGVPKSPEDRLRVFYTYSNTHLLDKPLAISGTVFAVCMAYMIASRASSIVR